MATTLLFFTPPVVPFTFSENVHEALEARAAPLKLTLVAPAVAVIVPPPQLPVCPLGVATTNPAGNVSVKLTPVKFVPVVFDEGFASVKLRLVIPFTAIAEAPNVLLIVGAYGTSTVNVAVAVFPVPVSFELTVTLLFFVPVVVAVTLTPTVHVAVPPAFAAKLPPVKLTLVAPATPVAVPPHVFVKLFGVDTTSPAGKLSVNANPVAVPLVLGLAIVNVNDVVPFWVMKVAPNALLIAAPFDTTRLAVAVLPVPPLVELTLPVVLV